MEKQKKEVKETQGVETQEKRNDSFTYALKSMKTLIEKLERNKWAENEEVEAMKGVYKKMVEKYIGLTLM